MAWITKFARGASLHIGKWSEVDTTDTQTTTVQQNWRTGKEVIANLAKIHCFRLDRWKFAIFATIVKKNNCVDVNIINSLS